MQELQTSTTMTEQINKALSNGVTSDPAVWQGLLFVWFLLLFLCPLFCCVLVLLLEDIHTLSFIHIHSAKPVPGERAGVVCLCVCLLGLLDLNYEGHFNLYLMTASTRVCVPFYGCECTRCIRVFIGTAGVKGCSDWPSHSLLLCIFVWWGQCGDLPTRDVLNWCSTHDGVSKTLTEHLIFLVANYWAVTILHDGLYNVLETTDDIFTMGRAHLLQFFTQKAIRASFWKWTAVTGPASTIEGGKQNRTYSRRSYKSTVFDSVACRTSFSCSNLK